MLVPLLVLLKIPQNVKAANFRLRINGSWFLLKRHPRFMFSALHTRSLGEEGLWFLGCQKGPVHASNPRYFRQGTQRPLSAGDVYSGDFTLKEVGPVPLCLLFV